MINVKEPLETYARKMGIALFLVRQELSTRYFLKEAHSGGVTLTLERSHDKLILQTLGLNDGSDETLKRYNTIMDKYASKLNSCHHSAREQAHKACLELIADQLPKPKQ